MLVRLKPGGRRPPLFALTAGDGNVVGFEPLAKHIAREQPLYALAPRGLDGYTTLDRGIEAMAARCVAEIRAVQPHGPYLLAGRCNGATVAYEIAQQLRRAGEEVPLLAALDSDPPLAPGAELAPGVESDDLAEAAWLRARERGEPVPERSAGGAALRAWLRQPVAADVSRYAYEVWHWREDLRERWPDPLGADAGALATWVWDDGAKERGLITGLLLPAVAESCRTADRRSWDETLARAWEEAGRLPEDPLSRAGWRQLRRRLRQAVGDGRTVNRYLLAAGRRPDLAATHPDPLGADAERLNEWAWLFGIEEGLDHELLPRPLRPLPRRLALALALRSARARGERLAPLVPEYSRQRAQRHRDRALDAAERRLRRPLPDARRRLEEGVVEAAREARARYRAEPWPGRVVLIVSAEHESKPAYLAWPERAAAGVERLRLPLGHVEMLRDPGARLLAECLDECIARALGR